MSGTITPETKKDIIKHTNNIDIRFYYTNNHSPKIKHYEIIADNIFVDSFDCFHTIEQKLFNDVVDELKLKHDSEHILENNLIYEIYDNNNVIVCDFL